MRQYAKQQVNRLIALETLIAGGAVGPILSINVSPPITSTGGVNPTIGITPATDLAAGSLSAADKTKLDGLTPGAAVASVSGTAPIVSSGGTTPAISITPATDIAAGSMSAADKQKLDNLPGRAGTMHLTNFAASPYQAVAATYNVLVDVQTGNAGNANVVIHPPLNPTDGAPFSVKVNLGDASAAPVLIEPVAGQPAIEDPSQPGTFRTNVAVFAAIKSGPGGYAAWFYNASLNQWLLDGVI